jgi:hypothetical protein
MLLIITPLIIFIKNILKKSHRLKKLIFLINNSKILCFISKLWIEHIL